MVKIDNIYIVKFFFDNIDYGYYIVVGNDYVPITYNNTLILLNIDDLNKILKCLYPKKVFCDGDESISYHLKKCKEIIIRSNWDVGRHLLSTLNGMDDILLATHKQVDAGTKRILYDFADHITFDNEFEVGFLQANGMSRKTLLQCFLRMEQQLNEVIKHHAILDDVIILEWVRKIKDLLPNPF